MWRRDRKTIKMQAESLREVIEENTELKAKTKNMHPDTGADMRVLRVNTELKDENKRLWDAVERGLSATNRLEGVALDLKRALYWRIPSRGERKVIVVKKKEEK